ncbi:hypothetical protein MHBO_001576 [Bonamia ostreae]|uniref:Uncharacterized protein n=1 Tax=Bonamia ostreae TaxID=126728 RepID=A0ABV2AJG6_9EUKA
MGQRARNRWFGNKKQNSRKLEQTRNSSSISRDENFLRKDKNLKKKKFADFESHPKRRRNKQDFDEDSVDIDDVRSLSLNTNNPNDNYEENNDIGNEKDINLDNNEKTENIAHVDDNNEDFDQIDENKDDDDSEDNDIGTTENVIVTDAEVVDPDESKSYVIREGMDILPTAGYFLFLGSLGGIIVVLLAVGVRNLLYGSGPTLVNIPSSGIYQ